MAEKRIEKRPDPIAALVNEQANRIVELEAEILRLRSLLEWRPIETAPKDGTKIDLLYPQPRGRTNNCFWMGELGFGWVWKIPIWNGFELAPESEWRTGCYPNMDPTHWKPLDLPSPPQGEGK